MRKHHRRWGLVRGIVAVLSFFFLGLMGDSFLPAFLPMAYAHDVVIASTPEDGATIQELPDIIDLTFSGNPKESFNTIALSNSDTKEVLFSTTPEIDGQHVRVTLPQELQGIPGNYTVGFQITSSDGHATRGKITFTVVDGKNSSPDTRTTSTTESLNSAETTNNSPTSQGVRTSSSVKIFFSLIVGLVFVAIILVAAQRVHRKRTTHSARGISEKTDKGESAV